MSHFDEYFLAHYAQTGDGKSYRISDSLSNRQFHDLTLYNEYYRQSSVEYQLVAAIRLAPDDYMVGIALDRDCADFTETERLSRYALIRVFYRRPIEMCKRFTHQ